MNVEPRLTTPPAGRRARLVRRLHLAAADRTLARGAVGTLGLNVTTTLLNFGLAILLARLLGADGYGAFSFALAWSLVLSSVSGLGMSPLVVRHVASMQTRGDWPGLHGLLRWTNGVVIGTSLLTAGVAGVCGWLLLDEDTLLRPFLIGLSLVLPTALVIIRQAAMQGLGRVVLGRLPETIVAPGLFLLLAAAVGLGWDGFSASWAIALFVIATMIAFALGALLLARSLPTAVRRATPRYESGSWARSALPLVLMGLVGVVSAQLGTILLGVFAKPEDTGVFALALRLSTFASFLFLASTYPLMPAVARLHSLGDDENMRQTVHRVARMVFLLSLPVALGIIIFAHPLLGLFGDDFRAGTSTVRILVLGELVKVFLGLSGLLLVMTGREADFARGVTAGAVVGLALSLALIPPFDAIGAAVATAAGVGVTHVLLTMLSHRRLGFSGAAWSRDG